MTSIMLNQMILDNWQKGATIIVGFSRGEPFTISYYPLWRR